MTLVTAYALGGRQFRSNLTWSITKNIPFLVGGGVGGEGGKQVSDQMRI